MLMCLLHLLGIAALLQNEPATLAAKKRFLAGPYAENAVRLLAAMQEMGWRSQRIESLRAEFAQLAGTEIAPEPFVSGDDLTAAGMTPGPMFKRLLETAYDEQLEGRLTSKHQALQWVLRAK